MAGWAWNKFLADWNEALHELPAALDGVGKTALKKRWLGYDGATTREIEVAERRLSVTFPRSYRTFLAESNGWRSVGPWDSFGGSLWPTRKVVYLLCPDVRTPAGEWEAWYFANWLPGATRYRSFKQLLCSERDRLAQARNSD